MRFKGANDRSTIVLYRYNPCYNKKAGSKASCQQHQRYYIEKEKDLKCPRTQFREDLVKQLKAWREAGNELIVCLDANQNIYSKVIGKELTNLNGLISSEVFGSFTGKMFGATNFNFRGSQPIDGVWATSGLTVVGACVMPVGFGVGDHRMFIVDFAMSSMMGNDPQGLFGLHQEN